MLRKPSKYALKKNLTDPQQHKSTSMPHDHRTVLKYPHKYSKEIVARAKLIEEIKHNGNGSK